VAPLPPGGASWFKVTGGDLMSGGALGTNIPAIASQYLVGSDAITLLPGMAMGNGVWTGSLSASKANLNSWLVTADLTNIKDLAKKPENSYFALKERILTRTRAREVSSIVAGNMTQAVLDGDAGEIMAAINAGNKVTITVGTANYDIAVLHVAGNMTIAGASLQYSRRAIFLVDGNVAINGLLRFNPPYPSGQMNNAFIAILAGGNIAVAPTVGNLSADNTTAPPDLEGIFYAQGTFSTGATAAGNSKKLRIDGSVIGMGGVNLQRRYSTGVDPAEYFVFRPEMTNMLRLVGLRSKTDQQLGMP
jgi:hypothetical protein